MGSEMKWVRSVVQVPVMVSASPMFVATELGCPFDQVQANSLVSVKMAGTRTVTQVQEFGKELASPIFPWLATET